MKDLSFLYYLLTSLFDREINAYEFMCRSERITGALSLSIRFLYVILLGSSELRELNLEDCTSLAQILAINLKMPSPLPNGDKQLVYYTLKISDLIFFTASQVRTSMMGRRVTKRPLMELVPLNPYEREHICDYNFWEVYYRHNNYFYDNNRTLFRHLRARGAETGLEGLFGGEKFLEEEFLEQVFQADQSRVTSWGVRACSLNDIIRFMIYLQVSLERINSVCEQISKNYKMDRQLAYQVFKETEDEFSVRGYIPRLKKRKVYKPREKKLLRASELCLSYLTVSEGLELLVVSKNYYKELKIPYVKQILLLYDMENNIRRNAWYSLLSFEEKNKNFREKIPEDFDQAEIIKMDLHRTVKLFQPEDKDPIEKILINVALDFPEMAYYQGLNYVAVFLYLFFEKDHLKAYRFLRHVAKEHFASKLAADFQGVVQLIFLNDKLLEIKLPKVWAHLRKGGVSCIHFAISCLITIFTNVGKLDWEIGMRLIPKIWDLFLASGFRALSQALLLTLKMQEKLLINTPADDLLVFLSQAEKDPLCLLRASCEDEEIWRSSFDLVNKQNLGEMKVGGEIYERLELHYELIHQRILKFWSEDGGSKQKSKRKSLKKKKRGL